MLLIAILLGAAFAWLVEIAWGVISRAYDTPGAQTNLADVRRRAPKALVLVLFLTVGLIYGAGIHGRFFAGDWSARAVVLLHYMTAPSVLSSVVAFAVGAMVVRWRDELLEAWHWLKDHYLTPRRRPRRHAAPVQAVAAASGAAPEPHEPYPWLMGIVGIAAVTLVATITLVIFFPEILMRVESIKVAGVEARFATAANRSIQVAVQVYDTQKLDQSIVGWTGHISRTKRFFDPAQDRLTGRAASDVRIQGDNFIRMVAVPLALVVECYALDFAFRETEMQPRAVKVAGEWGRVFEDSKSARIAEAINQTFELIYRIEQDLEDRVSTCGGSVDRPPRLFSKMECNPDCRNSNAVQQVMSQLTPGNIAHVKRNGFAISFVAHLFLLTHQVARATDFMEKAGANLDTTQETLLGQLNFYVSRAEVRVIARAPISETDSDLIRGVSLIDQVIACVNDSKNCSNTGVSAVLPAQAGAADLPTMSTYFGLVRAFLINNRIYNLVSDWLAGRRLEPTELVLLEGAPAGGLAYELSEWLKQQSLSMLLERRNSAAFAIATISDTLAVREIAIGASKNDLTRERCARIPSLLATAEYISRELKLKEPLRVLAEHRKLYENACPP